MTDKGTSDNVFTWNSSICECEYDKSCDVREYLDYKKCKCRKELTDKLVKECSEDINGDEVVYNMTLNNYGKVCNSCAIYMVLLVLFFATTIAISDAFLFSLVIQTIFIGNSKEVNTNTIPNAYTTTRAVIY